MPALIYKGDIVRALRDGIQLGDKATVRSGSVDPSAVARTGAVGDVYVSTSTGKIYSKLDSGTTTNWDKVLTTDELTFVDTFNNTTDWGAASGGYYTITITQATHQKGNNPIVQLFETNGSSGEMVISDLMAIGNTGDVSFRVQDSPDLRFEGKIVIK